jgi:GntR family transcriptional regulator/MocR family aminotransferase
VVRAYDQLYAEGFIEGRVGDGTYVAQLPQAQPCRQKNYPQKYPQGFQQAYPQPYPQTGSIYLWIHPAKLSTAVLWGGLKTTIYPRPPSGPPRAFRVGVPAFDLFPFEVWAKLNAAFWRKPDLQQLCYGDPSRRCALARADCRVLAQFTGHAVHR